MNHDGIQEIMPAVSTSGDFTMFLIAEYIALPSLTIRIPSL